MFSLWKQLPFVQKATHAFAQLERRDRLALSFLAAFLGLIFFYFGIWKPAGDFYQSARRFHTESAELVTWMQASRSLAASLSRQQPDTAGNGRSLLTLVTSSTSQFELQPSKVQPEGESSVNIQFEQAEFGKLVVWLDDLDRNQGLVLQRVLVDREPEGRVNARVLAGFGEAQ